MDHQVESKDGDDQIEEHENEAALFLMHWQVGYRQEVESQRLEDWRVQIECSFPIVLKRVRHAVIDVKNSSAHSLSKELD